MVLNIHFLPMLYIPFRFGRNGRKISYRHANRYEALPCSTSTKISACFGRITYTGRNTFLVFFFFFPLLLLLLRLLLLLLLFCFFCFCFFFCPTLSLFLYLWWTARRTAVTLQLAMKNQSSQL